MIKKIFGLFILAGLMLPIAANASTIGPAFEYTSGASQSAGTNYTFGVVFKPTQNIWVDYVGYYDPTAGMAASHEVAIFNSAAALVPGTEQFITSTSSTLDDHFYYTAITPVELFAGQTYVLDGFSSTDHYGAITSLNVTPDGFTVYAPITILGDNLAHSAFADTGTSTTSTANYFGADFGYYVTPEPSTLLLLGSGLAGLAGLLKRKLSA
jgi:hypothetical protein